MAGAVAERNRLARPELGEARRGRGQHGEKHGCIDAVGACGRSATVSRLPWTSVRLFIKRLRKSDIGNCCFLRRGPLFPRFEELRLPEPQLPLNPLQLAFPQALFLPPPPPP